MSLQPFLRVTSPAAPVMMDNIDTDRILPAAYMKGLTRDGLGKRLFDKMRYDGTGQPNPDFVLNRVAFADAQILISGVNFGCGSSREHAVWALKDYGIRAVIAQSFGMIFANNCARNGILLIALTEDQIAQITDRGAVPITIDLEAQTITLADMTVIPFAIDAHIRDRLLSGMDDITRTLNYAERISAFETRRVASA